MEKERKKRKNEGRVRRDRQERERDSYKIYRKREWEKVNIIENET